MNEEIPWPEIKMMKKALIANEIQMSFERTSFDRLMLRMTSEIVPQQRLIKTTKAKSSFINKL